MLPLAGSLWAAHAAGVHALPFYEPVRAAHLIRLSARFCVWSRFACSACSAEAAVNMAMKLASARGTGVARWCVEVAGTRPWGLQRWGCCMGVAVMSGSARGRGVTWVRCACRPTAPAAIPMWPKALRPPGRDPASGVGPSQTLCAVPPSVAHLCAHASSKHAHARTRKYPRAHTCKHGPPVRANISSATSSPSLDFSGSRNVDLSVVGALCTQERCRAAVCVCTSMRGRVRVRPCACVRACAYAHVLLALGLEQPRLLCSL